MRVFYAIFFSILILAAVLRFFSIGSNPPSLTWDETAWGYNAYSLGIDGRDEFGRFLPLDYIESFGDFKPPVYAYLDILPIKLLGLNEFAVRFPSAFFGVLAVFLSFFLVREIFKESKNRDYYAIFTSLFLAISPWHIMLSRAAFEANVASFFIILGVYLFLKSIRSDARLLVLSFISFALSMYTFNTARIVSPLIILSLFFLFRKVLTKKKVIVLALAIFVAVLLPLGKFILSPEASLRFKEVNIFSDISQINVSNQEIRNDNDAFWSKIIHNRRLIYSVEYLRHYFDNLSPNFLFGKGDGNPKFSIQEVGQLYLWDLPFMIIGIYFLFKRREGFWYIAPIWLIIGIIPAAVARETPHALRTETVLPVFQLLTAYGFVNIFQKFIFSKRFYLVFFLLLINLLYFVHNLFNHYAKEFSGEWQYGYKDSIKFVLSVQSKYKNIYVTDQLGRPYIYYLFYSKENPKTFRESATIKKEALGFVHVGGYGKYFFVDDPNKSLRKGSLYINLPNKIPPKVKILRTFNLLNGYPSLVAYTLTL